MPGVASDKPRLIANLRWGIRWGLLFAAILGSWAVIVFAIRGFKEFAKLEVTISAVIGFYFVSGSVAGVILGLCRPLLKWRSGAGVVGAVSAIVILGMGQVLYRGFHRPDMLEIELVVPTGIFMGAFLGIVFYEIFSKP